jgi:hypothetical protein
MRIAVLIDVDLKSGERHVSLLGRMASVPSKLPINSCGFGIRG